MEHPLTTHHPVPRALAAALLVATVLLTITAASTGPAGAASPPSLTATPNPVIVPIGQTSGTYDLTWNTGTTITADIQYAINGGPWSVKLPLEASGTAKDNVIQVNQTITWRLFNKGSVLPIAETTVLARHPDRSCLTQCIKDVIITPHGSYAEVHVIGTGPIKSYSLTAESPMGDAAMVGLGWFEWKTALWHLTPDTGYVWTLTVWDEEGNKQHTQGLLKTLRPRIQVDIDSISVADDSDELGEGEFNWAGRVGAYWDSNQFTSLTDSGETFDPNYSQTIDPDTESVVIGLHGFDDDEGEDFPIQVDACGTGVPDEPFYDWGTGASPCGEWATAYTNVPVLVDGVGESFTGTFALGVSEELMSFLAHGTYTVTYV